MNPETDLMLVKVAVVAMTAAFSLSGGLRLFLTYISWPTERCTRGFGALVSLGVAAVCWWLLGHPVGSDAQVLLWALLPLSFWQVVDALRAVTGVTEHRIEVAKPKTNSTTEVGKA